MKYTSIKNLVLICCSFCFGNQVQNLTRLVIAVSQWSHFGTIIDVENEKKQSRNEYLKLIQSKTPLEEVIYEFEYDHSMSPDDKPKGYKGPVNPNTTFKTLLKALMEYESYENELIRDTPGISSISIAVELHALALSLKTSTGILDQLMGELGKRVSYLRWCLDYLQSDFRDQDRVPVDLHMIFADKILQVEATLDYVEAYLKVPELNGIIE